MSIYSPSKYYAGVGVFVPPRLSEFPRWAPCAGTPCVTDSGNVTPVSVHAGGTPTGGTAATTEVSSVVYTRIIGRVRSLMVACPMVYGVGTNGETAIANNVTVKVSVKVIRTSDVFHFTWSGAASKSAVAGTCPFSDVKSLPYALVEGEPVLVCTYFSVPLSTDKVPGGLRLLGGTTTDGLTTMFSSLGEGTSNVDATATFTVTAGTTSTQRGYIPILLGYGTQKAVMVGGDSINRGQHNEVSWRQGLGGPTAWAMSGQDKRYWDPADIPRFAIGWNMSKGGATIQADITAYTLRKSVTEQCNADAIMYNCGTNDVAASRTEAQVKADMISFSNMMTGGGTPVIYIAQSPRTSSTDRWLTTANQTPATDAVRSPVRIWTNDGTFKAACATPAMVTTWNATSAVSCNSDGSTNVNGSYWKAAGASVLTGSADSSLTASSFVSTARIGTTSNSLRGHSMRFTSGSLTSTNYAARYNNSSNGVCGFESFGGTPVAGNTYSMYTDILTSDGIHWLPQACNLAGQTFTMNMIGRRASVVSY